MPHSDVSALHYPYFIALHFNIAWKKYVCGRYKRSIIIISSTSFTSALTQVNIKLVWNSLQPEKYTFSVPCHFTPSVL